MAEIKNCTTNFYPELCGVNVIVDPQATTSIDGDRVLIIGQKGETGTIGLGLSKVVEQSRGDLFGSDSMLNKQIEEFLSVSPTAEVWAYVLPNEGTAGEATVEITGVDTATASGLVYLWVNGRTYQANFDPKKDTNDDLAQKLQAVISATDDMLIASVAGNVVTIETKAKGEVGGFLDVRTSYGRRPDQRSSEDITVNVSMTKATGFPDLTGIASLTQGFEFVINPYYDDASVSAVSEYLCGQWSGGVNSRAYGVVYGDASAVQTVGANANNALISVMAMNGALTPGYLETSSYGGIVYRQLNSKSEDMAMSLTGERMPAMFAPEVADEYTDQEKAILVGSGVGYFNVNRANDVIIGRAVTSYTVRDNGSLDYSLQEVNRIAQIAYISKFFKEHLLAKYTGFAFRRDGVVGNNNRKVATIPAIRNYIISIAQELSNRNIIQDMNGFIESADIELTEGGCVQLSVDPELVDQFCCLNVILRTI